MPAANLQGINYVPDHSAAIRNEYAAYSTQWFVNRTPLVARLPRIPVGSTTFYIASSNFRTRSTTLGAAVANNVATSITLADASPFMVGDVLELVSGERVQITADPDVTNNTVTVTRGLEGTTAAAQNNSTTVYLVGNARTGGETSQKGSAFKPVNVAQYCQTWQHPVEIAGSLLAETAYVLPPGVNSVAEKLRMEAMQNLMDDMEFSTVYGKGVAPSSGGRPTQKGLIALITSGNVTSSPTSAGAYKPTDLIRDTLEKCRTNGGNPDILLVSSNFMTGMSTWGHAIQRLDAGSNVFGTPIDMFEAPFLGGVSVIEAPLLKPYTAIALTSSEVRMRMKRNEFWQERGVLGDADQGDWIAEGAIEVDNPSHHAMVYGITAFSAT